MKKTSLMKLQTTLPLWVATWFGASRIRSVTDNVKGWGIMAVMFSAMILCGTFSFAGKVSKASTCAELEELEVDQYMSYILLVSGEGGCLLISLFGSLDDTRRGTLFIFSLVGSLFQAYYLWALDKKREQL